MWVGESEGYTMIIIIIIIICIVVCYACVWQPRNLAVGGGGAVRHCGGGEEDH